MGARSTFVEIDPGHPSLPGHFPGRPIVPGVVLLDHAVRLALADRPGCRLAGIVVAKFRLPVAPAERVALELSQREGSRVEVTGRLSSGDLAFRCTLELAPCAARGNG
jgi:3-hydroxyacyl-[acyl-carrier-protein] dehydratase